MGTFRNTSKAEPCPICGKPDWCSLLVPDEPSYPGHELCVCRRVHAPETQSPINSRPYRALKELSDGSTLYTDEEKQSKNSNHAHSYVYRPGSKISSQAACKTAPIRSNSELNRIYGDFLSMLPLSKKHMRKARSDGWPLALIEESRIRSLSLPKLYDAKKGCYSDRCERRKLCRSLQEKNADLKGVPGFYQEPDESWTFVGKPGLLIPTYDTKGNLYRLRLRLDFPETDENGKELNKYKNFSSYCESKDDAGSLSNVYSNGCRSGSRIGVYYHPGRDDSSICYITEGEKKAVVANYFLRCIVISVPGVSSYSKLREDDGTGMSILDFLLNVGCKSAVVAYDADKHTNKNVLRCECNLAKLLKEFSFRVYLGDWNPGFGKGLDDILVLGVFPVLLPA